MSSDEFILGGHDFDKFILGGHDYDKYGGNDI